MLALFPGEAVLRRPKAAAWLPHSKAGARLRGKSRLTSTQAAWRVNSTCQ